MRPFFGGLWRVITFPLRALWALIRLPFTAGRRLYDFMTAEPEDRPLGEAFASAVQQPSGLWEHIDVLRKHLWRILIAILIGVVLCGTFTAQILDYLSAPIGGIQNLQAIDPTETVGVFMKVALWGGFSLSVPYIAFELWLFAAPGLSARARRGGLAAIPLTSVFFLGGMYFSYRFLLPTALPFLLHFLEIPTIPRVSSYISFVTNLLFWLGVAFEFPLLIYVLTYMGLVKPRMLLKQWRVAIVIIAVLAAVITPTVDPVNMALVMAPMFVLYLVSIALSSVAMVGRRRRAGSGEG
ncbi:MAG: twin-arginine translocase subunit TatC [Anaerolineales bacterium]|nr:twin-arginine translocase subunit TatC [Anaerolineales bacterium]